MMRALLLAALIGVYLASAPAPRAQPVETGGIEPYRVEAGDELAVTVLEDPGLNQTVLVRPDGRITLPLAGTIDAAGRTPEAVQDAIRRALADDFIEPPTVSVAVVGLGGETQFPVVYVLGEVGQTGPIALERPTDVLQALALAGGPGIFAATERIQIRRRAAGGGDEVLFFNYEDVLDGSPVAGRFRLRDGDVIVVPERGLFE